MPIPHLQVISAPNAPTGAVDTANEMLAGERARVGNCLTSDGAGPWTFRLLLRDNGRVRSAELISDGTDAEEASATTLTSCVARFLRTLRFRQLGTSIEVRVSKRSGAVVGRLRGTGRGRLYGRGRLGLGAMGTMGVPRVRSGRAEVRGPLSREVIQRVIRRHQREVRRCYEQALALEPNLHGRVLLRFTISGTGAVSAATVTETGAGLEAAATCIANAARRWTFPAPAGGIVIVTYPFMLTPG